MTWQSDTFIDATTPTLQICTLKALEAWEHLYVNRTHTLPYHLPEHLAASALTGRPHV